MTWLYRLSPVTPYKQSGCQLTCLQYPYSHLPVFNHRNIPRGVLPVVYLRINVIGLRYKVLVLRIRRK